MSKAEWDNK